MTRRALDRAELRELAEREAGLRRRLDEAGERRTAVQVALARLEDRRAELAVQLEEVSERLDQAGFAPPVDEAEACELAGKVERLSRRRERIGPVNPLAEAECAELGERAAFLREQRRDLEKSSDDLRGLITELTAQIDAEFAETFDGRGDAVRAHGRGAVPRWPRAAQAGATRRGAPARRASPWR